MTGRRRKLLDYLKKRRGYSHLKEEALDLCGELALEEALDLKPFVFTYCISLSTLVCKT